MVQITPVKVSEEGAEVPYEEKDEDYSDVSDTESETSDVDDFDADETFAERIMALKDIIAPQYRPAMASAVAKVQTLATGSLKAAWILSTSVIFFATPFAIMQSGMDMQPVDASEMREADSIIGAKQG
ncbi:mitochondrial outer membrane translocase complex, subunit Tom22 [Lipomyces arxii]|uniref:mitochondrial outer membrane translocase complex, subunit Tom22 n=1 Tax=Lipomyces arxii TaxID=56418 RepID=UPI0034D02068